MSLDGKMKMKMNEHQVVQKLIVELKLAINSILSFVDSIDEIESLKNLCYYAVVVENRMCGLLGHITDDVRNASREIASHISFGEMYYDSKGLKSLIDCHIEHIRKECEIILQWIKESEECVH